MLLGKRRRLEKWCRRVLIVEARKSRTTEKGPVMDQLWG